MYSRSTSNGVAGSPAGAGGSSSMSLGSTVICVFCSAGLGDNARLRAKSGCGGAARRRVGEHARRADGAKAVTVASSAQIIKPIE